MLDEMAGALKAKQADDVAKMGYRKSRLDHSDDKLKELGHTLPAQEGHIAALWEGIATATAEIDA